MKTLATSIVLPNSQVTEVLRELIENQTVSRKHFFNECGILNCTARISDLRDRHNIGISTTMLVTHNKFGRKVKYGVYRLLDKKKAVKKYLELTK